MKKKKKKERKTEENAIGFPQASEQEKNLDEYE